ncbi:nucleolar and spindle-associated protein 1 isoform X2 [Sceloporus undulatus]|uniref:nucleolar and spindle-associated protein 1 isoform X2 n=1 Tax=Sceloporus undulatus TaxID=8520 RepID=UPI001C4CAD3F|nr:nucleolar and spindle-associated protein 1 isoform X2 [Sceloporus undulatus]
MEIPSPEELEGLKYVELQRLAKTLGLKANLKAEKLLNVLKQHFREVVHENGSMVKKRTSSAVDTEESDNSQILFADLSMVTKKRRKLNRHNVQESLEIENLYEANPELHPEKEILEELKESEELQDAKSGTILKMNQDEYGTKRTMTGNLAETSATPGHEKENTARQKIIESKTPMNSLSGKNLYKDNLPKSGKRGISTTPNFKKIHEAQFKKMLSIDDYIEKKNKMICNFSNSANEAKMLAKKNNYLKTSHKETLNSNSKMCSNGIIFSPHPQRSRPTPACTPVNLRRSSRNSPDTTNKSILYRKSAFSSTGLSATKMNVRFTESTKDNEHKRSLTKTPSRKSPFLNDCSPGSQKNNKYVTRKNITGSTTKCQTPQNSAVTPSKFVTHNAEPNSTKPVFDLQASLSRPLNYQPHRGKLKPWGTSKENQSVCSHKRDLKQPPLQTREKRREKHTQGRKQRKDQMLGMRRGLTVV